MERAYDYKSKVFFSDLGNFKKVGQKVSVDAIKKLNSKKLRHVKVMSFLIQKFHQVFSVIFLVLVMQAL